MKIEEIEKNVKKIHDCINKQGYCIVDSRDEKTKDIFENYQEMISGYCEIYKVRPVIYEIKSSFDSKHPNETGCVVRCFIVDNQYLPENFENGDILL